MAGIKKLLLIRRKDVRANLIDESGFAKFVKEPPIPVSPLAWSEQSGLSHYGYVLEGLMLKDLEALDKWQAAYTGATLHDYGKRLDEDGKPTKVDETTEDILKARGLRINQLGVDNLIAQATPKVEKVSK